MLQLDQAATSSVGHIKINSAKAWARSRDVGHWERFTHWILNPRHRLYIGWFGGVQTFSKEVQS